jgi:uncharacterized membrane protein
MEEKGRSSTGLDENVAGFFCYLLGFITGIVFLVVEKESRFVKFHAKQSTITFLGLFVIMLVIGWIPVLGFLFSIFCLILWLFLMVKALRGERYMLPIVGKLAQEKTGQ